MTFDLIYTHITLILEATILVVTALFAIVNPIGSAATFLAMVQAIDSDLQKKLVRRITMYSFFLLFFSMLCGSKVLSFFGIALYSVQIGGGVIVALTGFSLLTKDAQKESAATPKPE